MVFASIPYIGTWDPLGELPVDPLPISHKLQKTGPELQS